MHGLRGSEPDCSASQAGLHRLVYPRRRLEVDMLALQLQDGQVAGQVQCVRGTTTGSSSGTCGQLRGFYRLGSWSSQAGFERWQVDVQGVRLQDG